MPRDREGSFEPAIVKKRQRRLTGVDEMVLSLSAKGLTHGEISAHLAEVYGAEVSKTTIGTITDKVMDGRRNGRTGRLTALEFHRWLRTPRKEIVRMPRGGANRKPTAARRQYFELVRQGLKGAAAARQVGVSTSCGSKWFIEAGSMIIPDVSVLATLPHPGRPHRHRRRPAHREAAHHDCRRDREEHVHRLPGDRPGKLALQTRVLVCCMRS